MLETMQAANQLAERSDRFAFFMALLVLGTFGLFVVRYMIKQNEKLVSALTDSHVKFQVELKGIVADQGGLVKANTEATSRQNELLREHTAVLKSATDELRWTRHASTPKPI